VFVTVVKTILLGDELKRCIKALARAGNARIEGLLSAPVSTTRPFVSAVHHHGLDKCWFGETQTRLDYLFIYKNIFLTGRYDSSS
jgi:hypothetical protein